MNDQGIYENREINEAIKKALAEKGGDYVYERVIHEKTGSGGCVYAVGDAPSCIVGHVLNALDPEMFKRVAEWEQEAEDTGFRQAAVALELPFGRDQIHALSQAQVAQDDGYKWSAAALEYAYYLGEKL